MNISHLPNNLRKFFRILEKLIIKEEKLKSHITFNKTCILNKLMPKYVNFKLHDRTAQNEEETNIIMLYCYKMYDTKLNQTYKFDCLEQILRI